MEDLKDTSYISEKNQSVWNSCINLDCSAENGDGN